MDPIRQLRFAALVVLVLIGLGTVGYIYIEHMSPLDALYMTVITITTVGYREVAPLSPAGKVFTIVLVLTGVSTLFTVVFWTIGNAVEFAAADEMKHLFWRRRMESAIAKVKDHYIICGYGRIGSLVASEFQRRPLPFLVIERSEQKVIAMARDFPVINGDATEEHVLLEAGIDRAKGLITVLHSDADNLFVTLTARDLNPKLYIISRYEEPKSELKLLRAGADKVISPYIIGGTRMAMAVLRPAVIDFIELATASESLGLQMEEVLLARGSPLAGRALVETEIRSRLNIIIIAIKKASGHMEFNPAAETVLAEGEKLIAIGEREDLRQLEAMARGREEE